MPSGKQPVSCIPCAKRKVRCDKLQPCCHCKRRKYDTCVYPVVNEVANARLEGYARRIEELERCVRSLGGDPNQVEQPDNNETRSAEEIPSTTRTNDTDRFSCSGTATLRTTNRPSSGQTSGLASHDDMEATYIETWVPPETYASHHDY